jgi:YNFM family putative membrane transporter
VITASLAGFALAGLLPEGRPRRTLALAMCLTTAAGILAALSPSISVLLVARVGQGIGTGFLIAGGLADIARNMPREIAGRLTGSMIAGTAFGGLLARALGYAGLLVSWRGAFLMGAAALLGVVLLALRSLPVETGTGIGGSGGGGNRAPLRLIMAGLGILFVNVGMFDLLPYRLSSAPFHFPAAYADLVYLAFLPGSFFAGVAGRAVDRYGSRVVVIAFAAGGIALMLAGLVPEVAAVAIAAVAAICGTSGLHVAHSGGASRYGRAAVGRYLAAYYVGGALAAPLLASIYLAAGWTAATLVLCAAWALVALSAATGKQAYGSEIEGPELEAPPARGVG